MTDDELRNFRMPRPPWAEREYDWLAPLAEVGKALLPTGGAPGWSLLHGRIWSMIRADELAGPVPGGWPLTTPAEVLSRRAEIEDIGRTWGAP